MTEQASEKILDRVRALLAKAEDPACTPHEAEAFSAKAEELIARYCIEEAMLAAKGDTTRETPEVRTGTIAAPYTAPKAMLLTAIAKGYRVHVHTNGSDRRAQRYTMAGFRADLDAVELLFASLQLQAVSATRAEADGRYFANGAQTVSFHTSFLYGFANEVGNRIRAMNRNVETSNEPGTALVLVDRKAAVDTFVGEMFPRLTFGRRTVNNATGGYHAGRAAGANANLATGSGALRGARTAIGG